MRKLLTLLTLISLALGVEVKPYGGVSFAFFSFNKTTALNLTNALLGIETSQKDEVETTLNLLVGNHLLPTVYGSGVEPFNESAKVVWAFITLKKENLSLDLGLIPTNVGYELPENYENPNITYGGVWNSQPFIYKGIRLSYEFKSFTLYGEYNQDGGTNNFAGGIISKNLTLNLFSYPNMTLVDLVLSKETRRVDLALNLDYFSNKNYGLALYLIPKFGKVKLPLRLETFKDRTYTITLTPTYELSERFKLRAEFARSEVGSTLGLELSRKF